MDVNGLSVYMYGIIIGGMISNRRRVIASFSSEFEMVYIRYLFNNKNADCSANNASLLASVAANALLIIHFKPLPDLLANDF